MATTFPPSSDTAPMRQSARHGVAALLLGLLAFAAFVLLVLPTDLILFDLSGILQTIAQLLYPLALGPEILFSPAALVIAVAAIIVARRGLRGWSGQATPGIAASRAGLILGWITIACCVVSLGLMILSFLGVLKPLI